MVQKLLYGVAYALFTILLFSNCTKEYSCENCNEVNKTPIANAGSDVSIELPLDSVLLDGSKSSDPDGKISAWHWRKITGPGSFSFVNSAAEKTLVRELKPGSYQFELKVNDDKGASAKDTVQVTVLSMTSTNHPPIACAGTDQTITSSTMNLDGSCSSDPDNNITQYQWTKISGPSSFTINNANAVQTLVPDLIEGIYQFELTVTDAGGLFSKDTMQVSVAFISDCNIGNRGRIAVQLTPVGNLSKPREGMAIASAGSKILFAGGRVVRTTADPDSFGSSQVDIYDVATNTWSTAHLSTGRWSIAAVAAGDDIFFAGGQWGNGGRAYDTYFDNVDIYDVATNTWKIEHLSEARGYVAAGAVGDKVVFAGGEDNQNYDVSSVVDLYDIPTGSFSRTSLTRARAYISAVTTNNKIYFAGGSVEGPWSNSPSAVIDIFDYATSQWTTSSLMEPLNFPTGTTMGGELYWAANCTVEVKNINSWVSSMAHPFVGLVMDVKSVIKDNYILFIGGARGALNGAYWGYSNLFDIYNTTTKTWSVGVAPVRIVTAISHNNIVYITDGVKVYKMDF